VTQIEINQYTQRNSKRWTALPARSAARVQLFTHTNAWKYESLLIYQFVLVQIVVCVPSAIASTTRCFHAETSDCSSSSIRGCQHARLLIDGDRLQVEHLVRLRVYGASFC
jgi:hypothetical protein